MTTITSNDKFIVLRTEEITTHFSRLYYELKYKETWTKQFALIIKRRFDGKDIFIVEQ
jgi:hypothetical protein